MRSLIFPCVSGGNRASWDLSGGLGGPGQWDKRPTDLQSGDTLVRMCSRLRLQHDFTWGWVGVS